MGTKFVDQECARYRGVIEIAGILQSTQGTKFQCQSDIHYLTSRFSP